ncbi:MAG: hypothetical protein Q9160_007091 [Pyrenula sp. 1 TL-2023]
MSNSIFTVSGKKCSLVKKSSTASQAPATNPPQPAVVASTSISSSSSSSSPSSSSPSPSPSPTQQSPSAQPTGTALPLVASGAPSNNGNLPTVAIPSGAFSTPSAISEASQSALPANESNSFTTSGSSTASTVAPAPSDSPSQTPSPDTSPSTSSPHDDPNGDGSSSHNDGSHNSGSKAGMAVGITIGLLVLVAIAAIAWYLWRRRRRNAENADAALIASEGKSRSSPSNGSDNSSIGSSSRIAFELASLKATLQDLWLAVLTRIRPGRRESRGIRIRDSVVATDNIQSARTKTPMRARASTFVQNLRKSIRPSRPNTIESFNDTSLFPPLPSPRRSQSQPQRRPPSPINKNPFADPRPRSNSRPGRRRSSFAAIAPNPFTFHPTPASGDPFADPPMAPRFSRPPSISDPDFPLRNSNSATLIVRNVDPFADPLGTQHRDPVQDPLPPPLPTAAKQSLAARTSTGRGPGWQPHHRHDSSDVIVLPGSNVRASRETTGSELARWQRDREKELAEGQRGVVGGRDTMRSDPFDLGL